MAIKRVALQRLGMQHKLAASGLGRRRGDRHLAAELVRRPRLAVADAMTSGRTQQLMAEAQFAAEELVIRVLQPARAQHFVRQVVHVLENEQPRHQPCRQPGLPRTWRAHAGKALIEKPPIDLARQPCQRMAEVDDVFRAPAATGLVDDRRVAYT
jgi:hypothetical protein